MSPRGDAPAKLCATVYRCIPVATVVLGLGVAAASLVGSLVVPALPGLKEMDSASPWNPAFDRAAKDFLLERPPTEARTTVDKYPASFAQLIKMQGIAIDKQIDKQSQHAPSPIGTAL